MSRSRRRKKPATRVESNDRGWWLCYDAEPRLQRAIQDDAVVLVDETFLVKLRGKLSGLALRDTQAADGSEIKAGTWYSPRDARARHRIRSSADRGATEVQLRRGSSWIPMREADESRDPQTGDRVSPASLLARARQAADRLPGRIERTTDGRSRKEYRVGERESHGGDDNYIYNETAA